MQLQRWRGRWAAVPGTSTISPAPMHTDRVLPVVGHNLPQEAPDAFASAVLELL